MLLGAILGAAGLAAGLVGGRRLARSVSRAQATQAGALLLVAIALLVLGITRSALAWLFVAVLAGYGLWRALAGLKGAARGGVGTPLSPQETAAFLARADSDEPLAPEQAAPQGVVITPDPVPRPARAREGEGRGEQVFFEDSPPSL